MADRTTGTAEGPTRSIAAIVVGSRFREDLGDLGALAASIVEVGLLQPVVIRPDNGLIAGIRRLEACKRLGWSEVPVAVVQGLDDTLRCLKAERDSDIQHKPYTPEEAERAAAAIEPLEREAAAQRLAEGQALGGKVRQGTASTQQSLLSAEEQPKPPPSAKQSRAKVAKAVGMSHTTLKRIRAIVAAAEQEPEKYGRLRKKMNRTGRVNGAYRELVVAQKAEAIAKEPPPLPAGPFRVLVIDPPWDYANRAQDVSHRAASPYPPIPVEKLARLPLRELAHPEGAILWLWATNAFLHEAFHLLDAWGFTHKTMLTWVKDRIGTGDWLRGQTEHCLLAIRGKPVVTITNQTTVLQGPLRDHSRKPESFYALVEQLCPGSKLELYARQSRPGWTVHGDEVLPAGEAGSPC